MRPCIVCVCLVSVTLAGCSFPYKPPEIAYDDTPMPAALQADPPKPVEVVEVPRPLPLPGQLKPLGAAAKPNPEPGALDYR
jgi:type IV secretion system protein TrbG